jgi:hypothetical protein
MNPALIYLLWRSLRGRIVRAVRLLKQPKYLVGILGFIAWMTFWVGGPLFFDDDRGNGRVELVNVELAYRMLGEAIPAVHAAVALGLALLFSVWWLAPWGKLALGLNEAEIHILTPMPVKRRHLIQYATLKSQPGILFGTTMMTIFLGYGGPLSRLRWFLIFWLLLTLWDMHAKGRSLWLHRQKELSPARAWRNRALLLAGVLVYWMVVTSVLTSLVSELVPLPPLPDYRATIDFIRQTLTRIAPEVRSGLLGWALLPFLWVTAPLFTAVPGTPVAEQLTAIAIPVALLVAHNEWVVRSQVKFEEAALAHARREADKKQSAARYWKRSLRSRRQVPFALPPQGPPEVAILWKNAMVVTRLSFRSLALLGLAASGAAAGVTVVLRGYQPIGFILMSIGFMAMALAPIAAAQSYRNDLRADLLRVEMVRPWPIEGWKLFAAEVAGPTVFAGMTALLGAAMLLAVDLAMAFNRVAVFTIATDQVRLTPARVAAALGVPHLLLVPLIVLGILPVVLALAALSATLQNLVVLLFPGWMHLGSDKQQGAAAFGQNMISFLALMLVSTLSLLPGALIIGIIVAVQALWFGVAIVAWELPAFGLIVTVPILATAALVIRAGGRVWDRLDPSQEILAGAG